MQTENNTFLELKYDYIPILPKLIHHVRRIDGFDVSRDQF